MKKYIVFIVITLIGVIVYYTELYTYFVRTNVQEDLPKSSDSARPTQMSAVGEFVEVDLIHKGSGQAKLIQVDGENILRFENFNVTSGPDLYVYLSKNSNPTGDLESLGDYVDLGLLKGSSGNQNYKIDADISGYRTAIVWCKRYEVLFTYAVME
jgi:hypothetical protein